MQPCTILHLSDIHLGESDTNGHKGHYWNSEATELLLPEHDRRGLLGSLLRDLKQRKLSPDIVVVTGDLLDRGSSEGVPMAVAFLRGLCEKLKLPNSRVVLIPGNHDIVRAPERNLWYSNFDKICIDFYGNVPGNFGPETPPYQRVVRCSFLRELGIDIVGFNSCESLDWTAGQEHGSIGTAQRDRAEELMEPSSGGEVIRIAAMHHHLTVPAGIVRNDYSVMDDAPLILQWLAQAHFHVVLHGHQHVDWYEQRKVGGWSMAITAGASAGVASYGRRQWELRLGYQIIVLDSLYTGRRIRREYDPQTREWIAAGRVSATETLHFGALPREILSLGAESRTTTSTDVMPMGQLLALGPAIIAEGERVSVTGRQWKIRIDRFRLGREADLCRLAENIQHLPIQERYVILLDAAEGRVLEELKWNTVDGRMNLAISVGAEAPRVEIDKLSNRSDDWRRTITGDEAAIVAIQRCLSTVAGQLFTDSSWGCQIGTWIDAGCDVSLDALLRMEMLRLQYIVARDDDKTAPLGFIARVRSVQPTSAAKCPYSRVDDDGEATNAAHFKVAVDFVNGHNWKGTLYIRLDSIATIQKRQRDAIKAMQDETMRELAKLIKR